MLNLTNYRNNFLSQQGFGQWIILVVLMLGIGVGVWVAQIRTNLVPQAAPQPEVVEQTEIKLQRVNDQPIQQNKSLEVQVMIRSDRDPVRLISAQIKYDPSVLELQKVTPPPSASASAAVHATSPATLKKNEVSQWLEILFSNKTGSASITALFEKGDFKTNSADPSFLYVTLLFKPKIITETELKIEDTTVLLRSADNANILQKRENLKLNIVP